MVPSPFKNKVCGCICLRQNKVSSTQKEFHSIQENEAPDMNVHSLASQGQEDERGLLVKHHAMQEWHAHTLRARATNRLGHKRTMPSSLGIRIPPASKGSNTNNPLGLSSLCPQQQGPVLKILCPVACQQRLRKVSDLGNESHRASAYGRYNFLQVKQHVLRHN